MRTERPDKAHIFNVAAEIDDGAQRAAYLDLACGGDSQLRDEVEDLLRHDCEAGSFLSHPPAENVLPKLGGDTAHRGAPPNANDTAIEGDEVLLGFLAPSGGANSLGRLGQYEITKVLGRGGMGVVLRACDTKLNRIVAVKVLAPELATNAIARKRFLREAQAAAAVSHDHVVTIYAVGEDRLPYLVMEYIDGQSLQQKINRQGPLDLKEILRIGWQIASGLAAAHEQGLVHRDVKPSNILLENGVERVRITDFGLARAVDDAEITQTGEVTGTPQYMSPEQAQGQPIDARSDLFSLGSVLYAMCTGRSPFRAETTMASLRRVCEDTPRPIRDLNPDIPLWLVEIVDWLLQKNLEDRLPTATEAANLLGQCLAHLQDPSSAPAPDRLLKARGLRFASRRQRWALVACILVGLFGGLGLTEATGVTRVSNFVGTVLRIRTPQGTLVLEIDDPGVSVAVQGNGRALTISGGGIEKLQLRPGTYQVRATKHGQPIREELVTIIRDGRRVVTIAREPPPGTMTAQPVAPRLVLEGHSSFVHALAFSPDGARLASGSNDQQVRLRNTLSGELIGRFRADRGLICSLAYSPDGSVLASGSNQGTVRVWDAATFELLAEAKHDDDVRAVAFQSGSSMLLSASDDKTLRLWNWNGTKLAPIRTLSEGSSRFFAASFGPHDNLLAATTWDGMLYLWDANSGDRLKAARIDWRPLGCIAFSPDGKTIAAGGRARR